ncbi:MAG: DUF4082 domain-containing protein [Sandaracinaceae bacterium]|nr:DUF4082 domain-containing protein [Sandaracinaceae bacterium]
MALACSAGACSAAPSPADAGIDAAPGDAAADPCSGVDCSALDGECVVGVCDPIDGSCGASPRADGASCDDGDACTSGDACASGACAGAAVDCSTLSDACNVGACDPAIGCRAVPRADGTSCDDGDACTSGDACASGACAGTGGLDCSSLSDACNAGACDPASGSCVAVPLADGTSCDDGSACTSDDRCTAGTCAGTGMDCSSLSDACHVGTCDPTTAACTAVARRTERRVATVTRAPSATPARAARACPPARSCARRSAAAPSGVCDPATGSCTPSPAPDGSACDDGNPCTSGDVCTGGVCAGTGSCPSACGGANTGPEFEDGSSLGANAIAMLYTATSPQTVRAVEVFTGERTGTREVGLWTHDAAMNRPGSPIATGTWTMSTTNGWQGATLSSPVSLAAGTTYWVVWRFMSGDQTTVQATGTAVTYRGSFDLGGTWNGPFTGPWKFRFLCSP